MPLVIYRYCWEGVLKVKVLRGKIEHPAGRAVDLLNFDLPFLRSGHHYCASNFSVNIDTVFESISRRRVLFASSRNFRWATFLDSTCPPN